MCNGCFCGARRISFCQREPGETLSFAPCNLVWTPKAAWDEGGDEAQGVVSQDVDMD